MNRKQKIIISVTGIFITLLILVGLTYAYFLTRIQGNTNTKSISVTTADLKLTYSDGNGDITATNILPGTTIDTKTFTVKNEGNATVNNYAVYLEELVNTLTRTSDMVYTLTCTSSVSGKTCNGVNETSFPTQNGMLVTNNIDVNETQSYELKVDYKEPNEDQSVDMGKTISGKVQIYNLSDIVDITGTVTNATSGDYVEMQSTPKTSQITNGKYLIPAVEPGNHTLYVKDKTGTVKGSKKITINKGSTAGVNGDTITVISDSQTIILNITNISSTLTTDIETVKDYSPFNDDTLASAIYTSAKTKANGTEFLVVPKVKPGEGISEYKTGKIVKETVPTGNLCSGYDAWYVGNSESAAQSGSTVSSYEEAVGKYVYDVCEEWIKKLLSYDSTTNTLVFDVDVDEFKPESTLSIAEDDYGTTYYYRGAVTDNYVNFADKLWRIVRINGDGSVRLVLDDVAKDTSGNKIETVFNSKSNDNAYVGYMYGTPGRTTYDATHKNINDSTIKTKVDAWYKTNIVDTNNADYVADTLFCNDKTLASKTIGISNTALGYGKNKTYYASIERLQYSTGTTSITISKPTFKCAETATNDYSRFTVNVQTLANGNKTNGNLTYPVGLLTADEVVYAGAYKSSQTNKTYYLYNSNISAYGTYWWIMSPYSYDLNGAREWLIETFPGDLNSINVDGSNYFRPTINLKADVLKVSGDGTKTNPYIIS